MIYYVVRESGNIDVVLASYYSAETANRYNPGCKLYEDLILSEQLGFSKEGFIVRGYSFSENGSYATLNDEIRPTSSLVLYAKLADGDWIPVNNLSNGGTSKMTNKYKQSLLLENLTQSELTPFEVLDGIDGDLKYSRKHSTSIYDDL